MTFSSQLTRNLRKLEPRRYVRLLLVLVIAAAGPIAEAGPLPRHGQAVAAGTITAVTTTFAAVEGVSFTDSVVAFTDSDTVSSSNFTTPSIDWGDGTPLDHGGTFLATIDPHLFFLTRGHTFAEEGSYPVTVSFHDGLNNANVVFSNLTATVDDGPLCVCVVPAYVPTTFTGSGTSNVTNAMAAFEAGIGGANNGSTPAPQAGGFRTINWDNVLLNGTDFGGNSIAIDLNKTMGIPINRFQTRGVSFGRVYAVSNDGFSDVNPGVTGAFPAFSAANTLAPFNTHEVNLDFVAASVVTDTTTPAASVGFGGIFLNVRNPNQTSIEYFDGPISLKKEYVSAGPAAAPAFLGVLFNQHVVTHVQLTLGSGAIFLFDGTTYSAHASDSTFDGSNVAALDDVAFGEPQPLSAPTGAISATAGVAFTTTVGSFIDSDPNANAADSTTVINWGDGHKSAGKISVNGAGGFNVSGSHVYSVGGVFHIRISVQDLGGAEASGPGSAATVSPFVTLPLILH